MPQNNPKVKAEITTVKLGCLEFDGLLLPDGSFGLSSKQVCILLLDSDIKSRYKDRLTEIANTKVGKSLSHKVWSLTEKLESNKAQMEETQM